MFDFTKEKSRKQKKQQQKIKKIKKVKFNYKIIELKARKLYKKNFNKIITYL